MNVQKKAIFLIITLICNVSCFVIHHLSRIAALRNILPQQETNQSCRQDSEQRETLQITDDNDYRKIGTAKASDERRQHTCARVSALSFFVATEPSTFLRCLSLLVSSFWAASN